jgi:hypothetical protein
MTMRPLDAGLRMDAPAGSGPRFTFTVQIEGPGRVRSSGGDVDCAVATCTATVAASAVTLLAQADAGGMFAGWSGACSGTQPTCGFEVPAQAASPLVVIARFQGRGDTLWTTRLESPTSFPIAFQAMGESLVAMGNFADAMTVGGTTVRSRGSFDVYLARFTRQGGLEWLRGLGGPGEDRAEDLATNGRDGILASLVVAGVGDVGNGPVGMAGSNNSLLVKHDGQGRHVWTNQDNHYWSLAWLGDRYAAGSNSSIALFDDGGRRLGEDAPWAGQHAWMVQRMPDAGFVAAGWYYGSATVAGRSLVSGGGDDPLIVRYAPSKAVVWVADTLRGPGHDSAQVDLVVDQRGDLYVTGLTYNGITIGARSYPGIRGMWLAKLGGADGRPIWSRAFTGSVNALAVAGDDLLVAGASLDLDGAGAPDHVVARLSGATGDPIWINPRTPNMQRLVVSNGRLFAAGTEAVAELIP